MRGAEDALDEGCQQVLVKDYGETEAEDELGGGHRMLGKGLHRCGQGSVDGVVEVVGLDVVEEVPVPTQRRTAGSSVGTA